jgi:hypothetical protein
MKCIDDAAASSPNSSSQSARPGLAGLLPQAAAAAASGGVGGSVKEVELSSLYAVFMEVMREKKLLQVKPSGVRCEV